MSATPTNGPDVAEIGAATSRALASSLKGRDFDLRERLALACRMLGQDGHASGLAGQITVRTGDGATFWTLPLGLGFDEACPRDFIRVDDALSVRAGRGVPNPATRFHLWIYRARPDVNAIVHSHPPHISALSMVGEPLAVAHMDATPFHDDCAYLAEWPGVPVADEEGRIIATALGRRRAILLAHHGQLVAGANVDEAAVLAIAIERAARLQLLARAVGPIRPIDADDARAAHDLLVSPEIIAATFQYYARQVLRDAPDCLG